MRSASSALRLLAALLLLGAAALVDGADLRVAAFRADVTPKAGEPLIWTVPTKTVQDPLWAKGVIIEFGTERVVLCAIDWCGLGNRAHALLRRKVADAAGTDVAHVSLHTVHQHTAPYVDASAYDLLRETGAPVRDFSDASLAALGDRLASAVSEARNRLTPFDRIGVSTTRVAHVASARRLRGADGKILVRYSTGAKNKAMADAPEGDIDPYLRTITLARGNRALVRLHYYATHPQTFCCEGTVTSDIVGAAREALEREDGVPRVYFTGAAGDVTVGKYNDESIAARQRLTESLETALRESSRSVRLTPVTDAQWTVVPLRLPKRSPSAMGTGSVPDVRYKNAITEAFARREQPLDVSALRLGHVYTLHLPGEPMLEFQRYAIGLKRDFVAVAGYGDIAPGYICTDRAFEEGGYEPGASNSLPGAERALKSAIRKALGVDD